MQTAATPRQAPHVLALIAALAVGGVATAATYHVDPGGSDSASGGGWLNDPNPARRPFKTLQKALAVAAGTTQADVIKVAQGVYLPTADDHNETASFVLVSNCVIEGGYKGGNVNPNDRDIATYETVLSGDIGDDDGNTSFDPTLTAENSDHVVLAANVNNTAEIEGFSIV